MDEEVRFTFAREGDLPVARVTLSEAELIQPIWPGLYEDYPADPAVNPIHRFGIHNGTGEALFLWLTIVWGVSHGLERFVCPRWYRGRVAAALKQPRGELPSVMWEYHVDTIEGPEWSADRGFRPAESQYPLRPDDDPWAIAHRFEAAWFSVETLGDLATVQRCLSADATSEFTLWGLHAGRAPEVLKRLRGPVRPQVEDLLEEGEIFADVALALDLVGDPRDVLTIRGPRLDVTLPPLVRRAEAAWAEYVEAVDGIADFAGFTAALDMVSFRILGQ